MHGHARACWRDAKIDPTGGERAMGVTAAARANPYVKLLRGELTGTRVFGPLARFGDLWGE
jgi:hypothetical protein